MSNKPIGTLGTVDSVTIGGRAFTDASNIIVLFVRPAAFRYSTFRKSGTTAGYQVTAGKTLRVFAAHVEVLTATGQFSTLGYGDNDVGAGTSGAPTNLVYMAGGANGGPISLVATGSKEYAISFDVPAQKYVQYDSSPAADNAAVVLYAYEF